MLTVLAAVMAFQAAPPPKALLGKSRPDTIVLLDSVVRGELSFFDQWSTAWKESEAGRHSLEQYPYLPTDDRTANIQCLPDLEHFFLVSPGPGFGPMISSSATAFHVCPSWYLGGADDTLGDERRSIDAALSPSRRPAIAATRRALLTLTAEALRVMPTNDFLVGQHVRLLVDANEIDTAVRVASECRASRWWCLALKGFTLARSDQMEGADRAFQGMLAAQPLSERCSWLHAGVLLADQAERRKYERLSCVQRDSIAMRLLWLSDPLLLMPGNERRVEQFVRQVTLILHTALGRDERYDWRFQMGSDARAEMIERYGWPSYVFWSGRERDLYQTRGLSLRRFGYSPPNEPYTTYEYTRNREHMLPSLSAAMDPFHARQTDWTVSLLPVSTVPARDDPQWFPAEHFAPPYRVVQLPEGQFGMFRRDAADLIATATHIEFAGFVRDSSVKFPAVYLVASTGSDTAVRVSQASSAVGSVAALRGMVEPRPTIVGVEIPPSAGRPAARTRFGVTPPPTLSAMKLGEVAISDPVLVRAPAPEGEISADPDSALSRMLGSTRFNSPGRVGVYWETYGFTPADTVDVAVWIERHTPQSMARNLGIKLKVAADLNTPVSITWREPQLEHRINLVHGLVPVISRSIILDLSSLAKGDYWLDVAVGRPGAPPVRSRREFNVQ